jgi:hypothetical protein
VKNTQPEFLTGNRGNGEFSLARRETGEGRRAARGEGHLRSVLLVQVLLWLWLAGLRILSLFAANQHKLLSISMLHKNAGFFNQGQSGPIKPNQVIL